MGSTQLVAKLVGAGAIRSNVVEDAFDAVDRVWFVPEMERGRAYEDIPLPLGPNATISQPSTVAMMLEWLGPRMGDTVLDIGSGSGWAAALLGHIVGPAGKVVGIERLPGLARDAAERCRRLGYRSITIHSGDGSGGVPETSPYNRIHVGAATPQYPDQLENQLVNGGRLVVPVGKTEQAIWEVTRQSDTKFERKSHPGFQFVPLITDS